MSQTAFATLAIGCLSLGAAGCSAEDVAALERQVAETERAFARTIADRDLDAFAAFVSDEAVFVTGTNVLRGKEQVVEGWRRYFDGTDAPFSWEPGTVVVLKSGDLALSTGPVFGPGGNLIAHFTSTWRREGPGVWRIVFDTGETACAEWARGPAPSANSAPAPR